MSNGIMPTLMGLIFAGIRFHNQVKKQLNSLFSPYFLSSLNVANGHLNVANGIIFSNGCNFSRELIFTEMCKIHKSSEIISAKINSIKVIKT